MEKNTKTINAINIKFGHYYTNVDIIHSLNNCKLTVVDGIRNAISGIKSNIDKEIIIFKELLTECRQLTAINTTNTDIKDFIVNNFETYSVSKIPVGYNNGYQWHIFVRNIYSKLGTDYLRAVEKEPIITKIETQLTSALKAKRRKTDVVKDIIANLNIQ